mmetsp:Transcript_106699/g.267447  ORF Transcript_106699/g.267447 Transcript_106699/m.267447 type:complete len:213 (-) Transcript_106699:672-1310(-)
MWCPPLSAPSLDKSTDVRCCGVACQKKKNKQNTAVRAERKKSDKSQRSCFSWTCISVLVRLCAGRCSCPRTMQSCSTNMRPNLDALNLSKCWAKPAEARSCSPAGRVCSTSKALLCPSFVLAKERRICGSWATARAIQTVSLGAAWVRAAPIMRAPTTDEPMLVAFRSMQRTSWYFCSSVPDSSIHRKTKAPCLWHARELATSSKLSAILLT